MQNYKALFLLFLAHGVSGVAQGISMLAIPWYFSRQGEMSTFSWIYFLTNIIALLWVPFSGTLVDKYSRKRIFLVLDVALGIILCGVAGLGFSSGELPWWWVGIVFMLTFFNYNLYYPNLYALLQEITEEKYYARITSLLEVLGQTTNVIAGAAAALLLEGTTNGSWVIFGFEVPIGREVAAWSIHEIILLDGLTYFLAAGLLAFMTYTSLKHRHAEQAPVWKRIRTGYQYLRDHPGVFVFGLASYCVFVVTLLTPYYLAAPYTDHHLESGGDVFAATEMYYALGAILAGLSVRYIFKNVAIPWTVLGMNMGTAALMAVLFLTRSIPLFFAMMLLLGICNAGVRILRVTYLFRHIPNQVIGRSNSIFFLGNVLFRIGFLALFAQPFFEQGNNVIYAFAILSFFLILAGLALLWHNVVFLR